MRIAIVGADDNGSLTRSFVRGSRDRGHEAVAVFSDHLVAGWRPLFLARRLSAEAPLAALFLRSLERRLVEFAPELILVVKGRFITRASIDRIRARIGCPLLNYYPDHPLWPGHGDPALIAALRSYDEVVVWADHVAAALDSSGVNTRVVGFGFDPGTYAPPAALLARRYDAVLIGQRYEERASFVSALSGMQALISGVGWKHTEGGDSVFVDAKTFRGDEICRLYWHSAVALNILAPWNVPAHNMRTFEIPASETVMVATRTPEHERLFGDDAAILVDTPDEARARILALLDDDDGLHATAVRGRKAVAPFTYASRMDEILEPWKSRS
jgi:spore maturation protein CgeB